MMSVGRRDGHRDIFPLHLGRLLAVIALVGRQHVLREQAAHHVRPLHIVAVEVHQHLIADARTIERTATRRGHRRGNAHPRRRHFINALLEGLESPAESKEVRLRIKAEDFRKYGEGVLEDFSKWAEYSRKLEVVEPNYEGVRVNYDLDGSKGWFLLRMSLHDPVMPLNIESETPGGVEKAMAAIRDFMKDYKEIEIPQA